MNSNIYIPRLCDADLQNALQSSGAVLIEGAKWCGKTSTASIACRSRLYMQDPDKTSSYMAMADARWCLGCSSCLFKRLIVNSRLVRQSGSRLTS